MDLNYFVNPVTSYILQVKGFLESVIVHLKSGIVILESVMVHLKLFDQTCGQLLHRFQRLLEAWRPRSSGGEEIESILTSFKGLFKCGGSPLLYLKYDNM